MANPLLLTYRITARYDHSLKTGPFAAEERKTVSVLLPHLQRAARAVAAAR